TAEPQGQAREFDLLSINVENPEECFRVCRELGEPVTDPEAAQHLIYAMQIEEMKARGMVEEDAEPVTGTATERERSQQPQEHQRDAGREQTLDRINELERKMEMQMEKNQKLQ
ncbi:MAG: hypothetical protein GWN18_02860, partial [Thermoplasmata archaeon]|nr:hypothetical protein [Thermoplasmata archaeon]NIU48040.1 hypothetical protein [Thermoplasmata archaeon]NIV77695.1 hypothetical protein [Thermoplasmata archaeon]NIW81528.1 hypothetical protein [Thermoplasmata archaeon]NIW87729.1 hypothetical protein [Thermoplasmata archaeon]